MLAEARQEGLQVFMASSIPGHWLAPPHPPVLVLSCENWDDADEPWLSVTSGDGDFRIKANEFQDVYMA